MFQSNSSSWESGMASPILNRLSMFSSKGYTQQEQKEVSKEMSVSGSLDTIAQSPYSTLYDYNKESSDEEEEKLFDFCGLLEYQPMPVAQFTDMGEDKMLSSSLLKGSTKIHKEKIQSSKSKGSNNGSPKVKRDNWKNEEDAQLLALYKQYGPQWSKIAAVLTSRTGKQIRERYINVLRPDISHEEWTEEEERKLMELGEKLGKKWCKIVAYLPGRTETQVKNKFCLLQKKGRSSPSSDAGTEQDQIQPQFEDRFTNLSCSSFNMIPKSTEVMSVETNEVDTFLKLGKRHSSANPDVLFGDNFRELSWNSL